MKKKIDFTDRTLLNQYMFWVSILSVLFSFASVTLDVIDDISKIWVGIGALVILLLLYLILWLRANLMTQTEVDVNNSKVIIKLGDIFAEEGLKVISFNEYFDTIVDNRIISESSLNGIYLKELQVDIQELDDLIETDERLNDKSKITNVNNKRAKGKKTRYKLGSIFVHNNEYLLTAASKFDDDNRAYLHMNDFINFLLNFWNEIDIIYGGRSVSIPLMGSGLTRIKEYGDITDQELLEIILWTFKISRIKFVHPSTVTIVIHESRKDKINFYKLKEVI